MILRSENEYLLQMPDLKMGIANGALVLDLTRQAISHLMSQAMHPAKQTDLPKK